MTKGQHLQVFALNANSKAMRKDALGPVCLADVLLC